MTSIVIPVYDDGPALERNLPRLARLPGPKELIVVDARRCEASQSIAERAGARWISSEPGRGIQFNAGAAVARRDTLLFLHADSWLDETALREIDTTLANPRVVAGVFRQRIEAPHRAYRLIEWGAAWRARWLRTPYGDSGLFLRRRDFEAVGGFPAIPLCEDLGIARRLRRRGKVAVARSRIHLSARRWEERGLLRTTLVNWWVAASFLVGVSPRRLYETYYGRTIELSSGGSGG